MEWLPLPTDFGAELKAASAVEDPVQRLECLARLADHRLNFLETIQLAGALPDLDPQQPTRDFVRLRVALLSSCTCDHLVPFIRVAGLRYRLLIDVRAGGFGQYRTELLEPAQWLVDYQPDVVLLSLTAQETTTRVTVGASSSDVDRELDSAIGDLRDLWAVAREKFGCCVVQQGFLDTTQPLFGSYDAIVPGAPANVLVRLNSSVAKAAAEDEVLFLDVAKPSARDGLRTWFDVQRWLQGKMEISPQCGPRYGDLVARILAAQYGRAKKCVVLDLDNTLWGGVVGDDGMEGLILGEGSAQGEAHLALQRYVKSLAARGIVVAVCSKNDPAIAERAFREHPEMLLNWSEVAVFIANWKDKAENLQLIAERLNIGLESLVFIDDNPAERARIRNSWPLVAVPELPADPALYVPCIAEAGYFECVKFTREDADRVKQYAANARRETVRTSAQSMDEYLQNLGMTVEYGPVRPVDTNRVVQLVNKTNQFNTTAWRCTSDEIACLSTAPHVLMLRYRLRDRFGDNGLVSVIILVPVADRPGAMDISNWVMSCRVFGRQLEHEVMNLAIAAVKEMGVEEVFADFKPTARNRVIDGLYETLGFQQVRGTHGDGSTRWRINVREYVPQKTFISSDAT